MVNVHNMMGTSESGGVYHRELMIDLSYVKMVIIMDEPILLHVPV